MRVFLGSLAALMVAALCFTGSAAALSCVAPPEDLAVVTITGDVPAQGWFGEAEVPVVVGVVVEGTPIDTPLEPRDRLALVEVLAGLRLEEVDAHVEIVADDLISWGVEPFGVGDHVFLRLDDGADPAAGILAGPCSWGTNQRYTPQQIEDLLVLADEHSVAVVFPTVAEPEPDPIATTTTTTTTTPTTSNSVPVAGAVGSSSNWAIWLIGALGGLAAVAAGGVLFLRARR